MNIKPISTNKQSVSDVIGVVVMITIAVAIAAAVNVSMSGTSSSMSRPAPLVSMSQTGSNILIIAIQNGPIEIAQTEIIIEDSSGAPCGSASFPPGTYLKGGDMIKISGVMPGEECTVSIVYSNSIVGQVKYIEP